MRKVPFAENEFYHIYNRGVERREIFMCREDGERFLKSIELFNTPEPIGSIYEYTFVEQKSKRGEQKLVNIICYCINPNHYHMLLQPLTDNGISEFIKRLAGGYTNYFNTKYKRSGALFQGRFKSIHIDSNEYLLHLSAYINLNNKVHGIKGSGYYSSLQEYIGAPSRCLSTPDIILEQFRNKEEYNEFAESSLQDILARRKLGSELDESLLLEETS